MRWSLSFLGLVLLASAPAQAQITESKLTYPAAEPDQSRAVPATLRIPAATAPIPFTLHLSLIHI